MSKFNIVTNNAYRLALDWSDLTETERVEFDYVEDTDQAVARFVRYKGVTYDLHEFQLPRGLPESSPLHEWDAYQSDSFFSGVVVRYDPADNDYVVMGTFYC